MTRATHSISKAIIYAVIVVALSTSSGVFLPGKHSNKSYDNNLLSTYFISEANDTCAYEIMEKYNCDEVGCTDQANYINYLYLQNCTPDGAHAWLSMLWVLVLVVLLSLLASTADNFFCVVMDSVVEKLKIPPSVAGVTFLAFGNGAPDVFSLIISVLSGMTEIGVGANVGAGMFVTTVVAGCVAVFSNCEVNRRAFLRDSIFYCCCIIYLIFVFFDKKINIWEGLGFIFLYLIYICFVFISGRSKKHHKEAEKSLLEEVEESTGPLNTNEMFSPGSPSVDGKEGTGMQISVITEYKLHDEPVDLLVTEMVQKQSPKPALEEVITQAEASHKTVNRSSAKELWLEGWEAFKKRSIMKKALYILEYPFTLLRDMSIPLVEDDRWNKYWILCCSVGTPFLLAHFCGLDLTDSLGVFPLWSVFLLLSITFLLTNIFCTHFEEPPKGFYMVLLVLIGFVLSVLWISAIANELVSLLNAIGLLLNISPVILGLTILAWGNSLGDLVADISLSRQGYPQMAIGGVYAAPMFNMLVGMGSALIIMCVRSGTTDLGADTANINLTFIFLLTSVLSSIIMVPIKNYKFTKGYGVYLFCLYAVYLVLNILVELKVIRLPWITPQ